MLIQSFWLPSSTDSEHLHIKGLICEQELDQCHRYDIRGGNLQENVPLSRFPGLLFSSQPTVTLYVKGGGGRKMFFLRIPKIFLVNWVKLYIFPYVSVTQTLSYQTGLRTPHTNKSKACCPPNEQAVESQFRK